MALRIVGLALVTAELARAVRFYTDALAFDFLGEQRLPASLEATLTLGNTRLQLIQPDPVGDLYPEPWAANDAWFQHFAIAVSDAAAAFDHIAGYGYEPISRGPPVRLPSSSGSVTAWKFRDPDGHPLEISEFPDDRWTKRAPDGAVFLGIDHTAVASQNLDASIEFYQSLGFVERSHGLNQGATQAALDGLDDPVVDIVVMEAGDSSPHLELLHYRQPPPAPARTMTLSDVAATRTVISGAPQSLLRDPDGHLVSSS